MSELPEGNFEREAPTVGSGADEGIRQEVPVLPVPAVAKMLERRFEWRGTRAPRTTFLGLGFEGEKTE